ncbi:MAG TPA: ankyrin repeat domain-containing protein [Marmoricola sp.]|nr:ankyrin repeat domain-containing protein [Marmoricola sp.]
MPTEDDYLNTWAAIREGDLARLKKVLEAAPEVITSHLGNIGRTPLHVVADWPGYFPNGPQIAELLIDAGAVIDARGPDGTGETPLHWTASNDDADVARVLIDAGADLEAPGGSIGTPLDNAIGYGCWNVARVLVASGARVERIWHAAALGNTDALRRMLVAPPSRAILDQALWHACGGGQRRCAELLVERGASLAFTPEYGSGTMLDAASGHGTQRSNLIEWLRERM